MFWTILLYAFSLFSLWFIYEGSKPILNKHKYPEGEPPIFFFGNLLHIIKAKGYKEFLTACLHKYGSKGAFTIWMFSHPTVYLCSPETVKQVLHGKLEDYPKGYDNIPQIIFGHHSLVFTEGQTWQRQRRILNHGFTAVELEKSIPKIIACTQRLFKQPRWTSGPVDVVHEMGALTLDVISSVGFNVEMKSVENHNDPLFESIRGSFKGLEIIVGSKNIPLLKYLNIGTDYTKRHVAVIDKAVEKIINDRLQQNPQPPEKDLLGIMVQDYYGNDPDRFTREVLRDQAVTFYIAGSETTANLIAWTLYALTQNPRVEKKLVEEIDEVLQGNLPTKETINKLDYMTLVLKETLRMYSPTALFGRALAKDTKIAGKKVPKNTQIMISVFSVHNNTEYWENPHEYYPERFLKPHDPCAWLPFSLGKRNCIGKHFAMLEAKIVLAMILQSYKPKMVNGHKVNPDISGVIRNKGGLKMYIVPKK